MAGQYDIGFGPLKGPLRGSAGGGNDSAKAPGETLEDGSTAAPTPTTSTLTIPGLSLTSGTYMDASRGLRAWVRAQWSIPTQGEHATDPNRVGEYQLSYTDRVGTGWSPNQTTEARDVTIRGLPVAANIDVRVRARTNLGTLGPYATATILTKADSTPPPVPSAPTISGTLRGASFEWDGTFAGGVAPPDDFQYVIAEYSLDPAFPPSATVECGERLYQAGRTAVYQIGTPPFTVHARLYSVDVSGNKSVPSAVTSGSGIRIIPADVGETAITREKLAQAAVDADKIAENAVTAFGIAPGAVTSNGLNDLAVTTQKIVDGALTAIKLAANSVTIEKIVDGAVVSAKLADLAITSAKVADNAIITSKISNSAVDNLKLLDDSVSTDKVAESAITSQLLAQFAVTAQKVGFSVGGGNLLLNSSFEDRGDPASPLAASVVPHWAVDSSCTMTSVPSSLVSGQRAVETTFDPNVGQMAGLT